jgi:hypothetical protein
VAEGQRADTALDGTSRGIQETKPQSHILMANIQSGAAAHAFQNAAALIHARLFFRGFGYCRRISKKRIMRMLYC